MNLAWTILASLSDTPLDQRLMRSATREIQTILFAALLLSVALVLWAIFLRRRRHRPGRRKHQSKTPATQPKGQTPPGEAPEESRRRRSRHHRRNPTLAETGGLPPRRDPTQAASAGPLSTSSTPPTI
jgi:hypothetical protein